jgi:hypothetical protein
MDRKLTRKLTLNRETLRDLTNQELREVGGGHSEISAIGCNCSGTCTDAGPRCTSPCVCNG